MKSFYLACEDLSLAISPKRLRGKADLVHRLYEATLKAEELPHGVHRKHGQNTCVL